MSDSTLLVLSGEDLPPYAARGLTQDLAPIQAASALRRTINAVLTDISNPAFRKFQSTINCTDQQAPALQQLWPGQSVTVDCVAELCYKTAGGAPIRTVVEGSSHVEGDYTYYRPRLTMKVISHTISTDEYNAAVAWSLALEEI